MNYSIFRFTLNMHTHRSQASVSAFHGDTAIRLYITITDGGAPYFIEDGCAAVLSGTKADGTKLHNRCAIENNSTIVYDFTDQTTSCVGIANCEITLYGKDGGVVTAPKFAIVVDEREVGYDDVVESVNDKTLLDSIVAEEVARVEAEKARIDAENQRCDREAERWGNESSRGLNESQRSSAESDRVISEISRSFDESKRVEAENARVEAENARVVAEASRVIAENSRVAAEESRVVAESLRAGAISSIQRRVKNMEAANDGKTFDFDTQYLYRSYVNQIPEEVLPYATIDEIGGLVKYTSKDVDVMPKGYVELGDGEGIHVTYNSDDNSFTFTYLSSVATQPTVFITHDSPCSLLPGNYTFELSNSSAFTFKTHIECYKNGQLVVEKNVYSSSCDIFLSEGADSIYISTEFIGGGANGADVVTPKLIHHSVSTKKSPVTAVKTVSKNLVPYPPEKWNDIKHDTSFGSDVTFEGDGDGSIYVSGQTGTEDNSYVMYYFTPNDGTDSLPVGVELYKSSGTSKVQLVVSRLSYDEATGKWVVDGYEGNTFTPQEGYRYRIYLQVNPNTKVKTYAEPMICSGTGEEDFVPHTESIYEVPEAVQAIEGYGLGISRNYCNYINFEDKTFVRQVEEREYQVGDKNSTTMKTDYVTTICALEEEETVDISDILSDDNFISVESGGYIMAENVEALKVSFLVTYQIKL